MKDDSAISAALLAVAALLFLCGDTRAAAWVGIPGVVYTAIAVWRAERS